MWRKSVVFYFFLASFTISVLLSVYAIFSKNELLLLICKPFTAVLLLLNYVFFVKNRRRYSYIIYLLCIIFADVLYYLKSTTIPLAMFVYTAAFTLLTATSLTQFNTKLTLKQLIGYSLFFIVPGLVVYNFILKNQGAAHLSTLCFIFSLAMMVSASLLNYLKNMSPANSLFALGCLLMVFSDLIMSLNIYNKNDQVIVNTIFTIFIAITHYVIMGSFVLRDANINLFKSR